VDERLLDVPVIKKPASEYLAGYIFPLVLMKYVIGTAYYFRGGGAGTDAGT
jgi:hypothetical protein